MDTRQKRELHILLVEDDTVDVEAVRKEFETHRIANRVHTAKDGVEALVLLQNNQIPKPYIVLLDLNMPRMGGIEFLKSIREDSKLQHTIVFVITTSENEIDKAEAYDYNVAGYIKKASLGRDFMQVVSLCDHYWRVVEFPV